jgi:hypothetical protein
MYVVIDDKHVKFGGFQPFFARCLDLCQFGNGHSPQCQFHTIYFLARRPFSYVTTDRPMLWFTVHFTPSYTLRSGVEQSSQVMDKPTPFHYSYIL